VGADFRINEQNPRVHGQPPFTVAVIHGGPGAPGSVTAIARELSRDLGVLEPFQTAATVSGEVEELKARLSENADVPVALVGWSWGAWLSFIFAAKHPGMVRKVILVGSGAFAAEYAASIMETRLSRLSVEEREEALSLMNALEDPSVPEKGTQLDRFGALMNRADSYDPLDSNEGDHECRYDIFESVWREAAELRASGRLLEMGGAIRCPVVAIHGDHDPHLAEGVERPLSAVLGEFKFVLLKNCGHVPWMERQARDEFFRILLEELGIAS
jgi:pimeloyl-ACP methyl ester carboxylesterase